MVAGASRERCDVVLSRTSLQEMWTPGKPMAEGADATAAPATALQRGLTDAALSLLGER